MRRRIIKEQRETGDGVFEDIYIVQESFRQRDEDTNEATKVITLELEFEGTEDVQERIDQLKKRGQHLTRIKRNVQHMIDNGLDKLELSHGET
jgi:hypothetical protein